MVILECGEGHGEHGQGRWSGQCYVCLDLDKISLLFHNYTNAKGSGKEKQLTIDCVVGRVKVGDRWGIIDRSLGSERERAVMHGMWEPEYESEDAND